MPAARPVERVLFLCTGNYYRSRFAEECFNALAKARGLEDRATSRGLHEAINALRNPGPISPFTLEALAARQIVPAEATRTPARVTDADLDAASCIVAIDESEHRFWIERDFPRHAAKVRYWKIHDLDRTGATEALAALESEVGRLLETLTR